MVHGFMADLLEVLEVGRIVGECDGSREGLSYVQLTTYIPFSDRSWRMIDSLVYVCPRSYSISRITFR
jgi:hypothetical protein